MNKISAVIIDDEQNAIEVVKAKLTEYFPNISVVDTCQVAEEAIGVINLHQPQLVFIDIEMPKFNGFDIIKSFGERNFEVIFITAYDKYAIEAFKENALGYILKPIDRFDFIKTVSLTLIRISQKSFSKLQDPSQSKEEKKLAVLHKGQYELITCAQILYFKAEGSYTKIKTHTESYVVSKNLKTLTDQIVDCNFLKINRSFVINPSRISGMSNKSGSEIIMEDGMTISVSQPIKEAVFQQLSENVIFT